MHVASSIKLHDLVLSFLFENEHRFKNFLRSLCKVLVLCDFLNLDCLRIIATPVSATISQPQRFDFLIECILNDGTCQFCFSHNENIEVLTII